MKVELVKSDKKYEIALSGEIDCSVSDAFYEKVMEIYESEKKDIVFDCGTLTFIDSTTLGTFVKILKHLKSDGHAMSLVRVQPLIMKVFTVCSLDTIMDIS